MRRPTLLALALWTALATPVGATVLYKTSVGYNFSGGGGNAGYFGMFAVDPDQQNGGLGKAVLAEAERIAREQWQCHAMRMTVIEQRAELIAWYERRGYRRTGECQPFPYGDERFGIPRRDDLRFEVLVKDFAGVTA